jgi:uncharacterized repeat protein (TIGR01451 family)
LLAGLAAAAMAADAQISSLVDEPDPVPAGGLYTYGVVVDNNAVDAALNTVLRVTVPSGATFVSAAPAGANCAPVSPTVVECNLGSVAALGAGPRNVSLTWRALGPGPASIGATATVLSSNDANPGNNTQTATTTVISGANLSMSKVGTPNPVVGGSNVTYTLTASNAGPNAGGAIVLTDNLPPSVSFVSAAGSGWSCAHASGVVTCTRPGPQPVGAAIPAVTVVGRVNASGGTITNSASIAPSAAGGIADPETGNNTATADTTVLPGADVRMAQKRVTTPVPATAGSEVTFVLEPRNGGPATATDVVVTDTLPAGWTLISASGPNFSCALAGQTATCSRATLPFGAADNITITARAPDNAAVGPTGRSYTNTGSIGASSADPNPGNNNASVNVQVLPDGADLRLSKSKTPNPVALGSDMTSTVNVTNNGPRVATGPLRVIEQLSGESYVGASGTGWVCTPSGNTVVCEHPNTAPGLAVGASLPTLRIVTRATSSGAVSNTACTGGSVPAGASGVSASPPAAGDPNPTNDCASVSATSTTVRPDLAIAKTTSTPTGGDKLLSATEASVTYTLVVSNVSATPEAASGIRVTDTVPGFISGRSSIASPVVATASSGSTALLLCSVSGAAVTCNQIGGALRPGETVTIPITVNRPLQEGSYTNTATVSNTREGDPNAANNSASDTVTIEPIADVEMTGKSVTPNPLRAGENATYVLSFRNNGPSPALNVSVSDSFSFPVGDNGATVVSIASSKGGSSCSIAAGVVLTPANPSFNCTIGTLANGETQSITLVVRPNFQGGNAGRSFGNTARVSTSTPESPSGGDNGNNERSATLAVSPAAIDLLTNKTDIADPVGFTPGSTFIGYRVRLTSNGPSFGTSVRINENMVPPAGKRARFVCDTTTFGGSTCNTPSLCTATNLTSPSPGAAVPAFSCQVPAGSATTGLNRGELASGQSKDIFLRFEVLDTPAPTGDIFLNTATVVANEPDTFAGNDSEGESTTARQRVDLRVTKAASVSPVALRQPFVWTVTVNNFGPGTSLQTDLTDTLPAGVEVTGPITWTKNQPAGSGSCTRTGQQVSCALGALSGTPAGTAIISIPVRFASFPAAGSAVNSATVDVDPNKTGGIDTPGGNNTGTSTVPVTRSSLAGSVFEDRDRAGANGGVPQAVGAEPRLAGVQITITGTDAFGNAVNRSTTTDASGNYRFDDLSPSGPGGYTLTQTQPAGFVNGPISPPNAGLNAPSLGGSYSAGGPAGNSSFSGIAVGAADAGAGYNFPELRQPSLSGFVYIDADNSGVRTPASDPPVPGATVRLLDANTLAVIATTTTNASGAYSFSGLDPLRSYALEQPLPSSPAGLANGPVNAGLVNGVACASGCIAQPNTPAAGTDRIVAIDLSAGTDGTQFNFGERQVSTISGLVFVDANRNNALDPSDTQRLSGVTVRLVQGADCSSGNTLQTTSTAADGSYSFAGVEAGRNYLVCQTQPAGYGTGSANGAAGSNAIAITNLAPGGSANNNFGETLAAITGSVFVDNGAGNPANFNNGLRDGGEAGIAGVPMTLTGTDVNGNAVNAVVNTDANGNYVFEGLIAGSYTVSEGAIPPAAGSFLDGLENAGSSGGNTAVNDVVSGIALGAGAQAVGLTFGELPSASISGTVYLDRNRDNQLNPQPTDGRLPGVTLTLYPGNACTGTPLATVQSDANGNYSFNNVAAGGSYTVCQTQPVGYQDGGLNPGANGSSSAANAITVSNLPSGGSTGNHFAERAASLSGSVYADFTPGNPALSDNGERDAGEAGIAGVLITLTGTDATGAAVNRSTTTDANGNWRFDDLLAAGAVGYSVAEGPIPPVAGAFVDGRDSVGSAGGSSAVNDVLSGIALSAGTQATGYLFGELPRAAITGSVYLDRNRNNTLDPLPGDGRLSGVTINLFAGATCSGTPLATVLTDADGNYAFTNVAAGSAYSVCQVQPAGYANGAENPGSAASSPGADVIRIASLPETGSVGNHFGERTAALSGSVYVDVTPGNPALTNNGQRDAGEVGLAGVPVTLSGTDTNGNVITRAAVTDVNGDYRFDDLLAGNYTVIEGSLPPALGNYNDGLDTAGSAGGSTAVNDRIGPVNLAAGLQATGYLFGELSVAPISGTVFIDRNRDGVLDALPTDGRLPGVTLTVRAGNSCAGPVLQTVQTDASGNYSFSGLTAGQTYTVCQVQPAGYGEGGVLPGGSATAGSNAITISNLPAGGSAGNQFAERVSSLAGSVYVDFSAGNPALSNNGVRDAGEAGIAGVPITLTGTDAAGNPVNRNTLTDASGNWRFEDLLSGSYTVSEGAIPSTAGSFLDGRDSAGTAGGSTAVNDSIGPITLPAAAQATGYLFGELPAASISGTVYIDRNRNNTLDALPTDGRLPGVTLRLVQGADCVSGSTLQTAQTDADGNYRFDAVAAGASYLVCQAQPNGYANGSENPGGNGSGAGDNAIRISNLPAAGSAGNHFAERVGSLAGSVFLDANNDGARAPGDAGIAGVAITLTGVDANGNPVNRSTTTDANGNWRFEDLLASGPGGYTLTEQAAQPAVNGVATLNSRSSAGSLGGSATGVATTPSAINAINLAAGAQGVDNLFAEILPVSLSGTVFVDADNNGVQAPGEAGIGGQTLQLTGTDDTGAPVSRTVTTDADGRYNLPDLRPGLYTLTQPNQPPGTVNGQTVPGSAGGTATPPATTPSAITGIVLTTPGGQSSGNNFAEIPNNASLSGRVWLDANNNASIDGTEAGIAGVLIELSGTDALGNTISRSTSSDASGNWRFDNLPPGTYSLREPNQPPDTLNGSTVPGSSGGTATPVATVPSAITGIPLAAGQASSNHLFGEIPPAELSGRVFGDLNNNGLVDAGEAGIGGVTIRLTGTDDLGNAISIELSTAADGRYRFPNLRPGTYTLTEPTQPFDTVNGITSAGSAGGTATPVATAPSAISAIVLGPGVRSIDNNFAELTNSPDLRVSKEHAPARFTATQTGSYTLRVRNVGQSDSTGEYSVNDRLPAGLSLLAVRGQGGWACEGAVGGNQLSCRSSTVVAAGAASSETITVEVRVGVAAALASPVNNAVLVEGGGEIDARRPSAAERDAFFNNPAALPECTPAIEHNACRRPTPVQAAAAISGTVWYDVGPSSRVLEAGDRRERGWLVEVVDTRSNSIVARAITGPDGNYRVADLEPGVPLAVRFRDPDSGVVFGFPVNGNTGPGSSGVACDAANAATRGTASSCIVPGANPQLEVVLAAGQELPQQSLPIDPSGVVYDSGLRQPVPGSVVTLLPQGSCPGWAPATSVLAATLGGYTINGDAISMTVGKEGLYQFFFTPSAPASCTFGLSVTPPAGYRFVSTAIPPSAGPLVPPGAPGSVFNVQPQATPPVVEVGPETGYFLSFVSGSAGVNVLHNHIPLDPDPPTGIGLVKTADKAVAEVGDSIRYTLTVTLNAGPRPRNVAILDRLPAGFTFIKGTATVNDVPIADPSGNLGPLLAFELGEMPVGRQLVLKYRARVGVGAMQGDGINSAQGHACGTPAPGSCVMPGFAPRLGGTPTNVARFRVRVSSGVFAPEACVVGKIFVDCNRNHVQDKEEIGIPGVRMLLSDGTTLVSDSEGKYSICGLPPKSTVIKPDPMTLPDGIRLTTSSNRNLGDATSLWLDLKNGELHRADFVEGSCSNRVLDQVKARRAQGEVRAPEVEKKGGGVLRFDSKAHGLDRQSSPQQGTDSANQPVPRPRAAASAPSSSGGSNAAPR